MAGLGGVTAIVDADGDDVARVDGVEKLDLFELIRPLVELETPEDRAVDDREVRPVPQHPVMRLAFLRAEPRDHADVHP